MKKISVKRIAFDAIFCAITCILYFYAGFELPIFPSFLEINLSMIPVFICSFMIGPVDGAACVVVRCLIKLAIGSGTSGVGELADLLIGLPIAIYAGIMYNYTKFKHKELLAFLGSILLWMILGVLTNYLISVPFYITAFFGGNEEILVNLIQPAISLITFNNITVTLDNYMEMYLLFAVVPFNLLIAVMVCLVTLPVHKRLKALYKKFDFKSHKHKDDITTNSDNNTNDNTNSTND